MILEDIKPIIHIIIWIFRLIFWFGRRCAEFVGEIITGNNSCANRAGIISYPVIRSNDGVIMGIPAKIFQPQKYGFIG